MEMIEVTNNDIHSLSDVDLRILIGKLCEAELASKGLSTSYATYGGHHNAADGGIDVKVSIQPKREIHGFIPRPVAGYQVKKMDLQPAQLKTEIAPNGVFKSGILRLIESHGAYIVAVGDGTSDLKLRNRRGALNQIFSKHKDGANTYVDFYDNQRIASWVNSHPAIILWVRDKVGNPVYGWKSYHSWIGQTQGEYFVSDRKCFRSPLTKNSGESKTILQGIEEVRTCIRDKSNHVRLIGLSGVGKTRFLQALFEKNVGSNELNEYAIFYTDSNYDPRPSPIQMLQELIASDKRIIFIVDNCDSSLHKTLTNFCKLSVSKVRIITTEYDISEDQPEETNVYRLEANSEEVIASILRSQFPGITYLNVETITLASGGNARIAISLASTIGIGEDISGLRDVDLFDRLFDQKKKADNELVKAAEIMSLVYSFEFTDDSEELKVLSDLAKISVEDMFKYVKELERRDLIQKRSQWRALLPHALSNTLANKTLQNTPLSVIKAFLSNCNLRLFKSFFHRLSFLHSSQEALNIAEFCLFQSGNFDDVEILDDYKIDILQYLSQISPKHVITHFESTKSSNNASTFLTRQNRYHYRITRLIKYIAYDADLFDRCVNLLIIFCRSEQRTENINSIRNLLKSLFHIRLSNTHATPKQRFDCIKNLLNAPQNDDQILGIDLLKETFKTKRFGSMTGFVKNFQPRNYGYYPKNNAEAMDWFKEAIGVVIHVFDNKIALRKEVINVFSIVFSGLWSVADLRDILESTAIKLNTESKSFQLWISANNIVKRNREKSDEQSMRRAYDLANQLAPITLIDRARVFSLSGASDAMILLDPLRKDKTTIGIKKVDSYINTLGKEVGADIKVLEKLLPDILLNGHQQCRGLGQGVAIGSENLLNTWAIIEQKTLESGPARVELSFSISFLRECYRIDRNRTHTILDSILANPKLQERFLVYQSSIPIDAVSYNRIVKALRSGIGVPRQYISFIHELSDLSVNDEYCASILELMSESQEGLIQAIKLLYFRLDSNTQRRNTPGNHLKKIGSSLLMRFLFDNGEGHEYDKELSLIYSNCIDAKASYAATMHISTTLLELSKSIWFPISNYKNLIDECSIGQPNAVLSGFLDYGNLAINDLEHRIQSGFEEHWSVFDKISDENILKWCQENRTERIRVLASVITPFCYDNQNDKLKWSFLGKELLKISDNSQELLELYYKNFDFSVGSKRKSEILNDRLPLFDELLSHSNVEIVEWATRKRHDLMLRIEAEIDFEKGLGTTFERKVSFE